MQLLVPRVVSRSGSGGSTPLFTADGVVLFTSNAIDLVHGFGISGNASLYARDLGKDETTLVSANASGSSVALGSSTVLGTSEDGRYILFVSDATNLVSGLTDFNHSPDVFVRDVVLGKTTIVSVTSTGTNAGNNLSDAASISSDGRYVVFRSRATNLVAGITDGAASYDVFLRDLVAGTTTLVSVAAAGAATGNGDSGGELVGGRVTPDGRHVVFGSAASNLLAGGADSNGKRDVFVRDLVAGTTTLVSVAADDGGAAGDSQNPFVSDDGLCVAFQSTAGNLVAVGDGNGVDDVFVRDLSSGQTHLVSVTGAGAAGNGASQLRDLSADGHVLLFTSSASDLAASDGNGQSDVFVRDWVAGTTTLASVARSGGAGNGASSDPVMTSDGKVVAFASVATDLVAGFVDRNGAAGTDVYVRDVAHQTTELASVASSGAGGNGPSSAPSLSPDGRQVAFASTAADLGPNLNGASNVFVRHLAARQTSLVSVDSGERLTPNGGSGKQFSTPDGRWVVFESGASDLVADGIDDNGKGDVFLRDRVNGVTELISVAADGQHSGNGFSGSTLFHRAFVTPDGRFVLFTSLATDLVPNFNDGYLPGYGDLFRRDRMAGTTQLVSVNADGTAAANGFSETLGLSDDGRYALFGSTANDLVPDFVDGNGSQFLTDQDLYVRDMQLGQTELVTVGSGAMSGNGPTRTAFLSTDGRKVVFETTATNLVAGFDANGSNYDVFVRDLDQKTTRFVSVAFDNPARSANDESGVSDASPDARFITFFSFASNLVPNFVDGNGGFADTFVRDMLLGQTALVSLNAAGTASGNSYTQGAAVTPDGHFAVINSGASDLAADPAGDGALVRDLQLGVTELISVNRAGTGSAEASVATGFTPDARFITFRSQGDVLQGITGDQFYRRDRVTRTTDLITRNLSGGGSDGSATSSGPAGISPDGQLVFFGSTGDELVEGDLNLSSDLFVWDPAEVPTPTATAMRTRTPTRTPTGLSTPTPTNTLTGGPVLAGDCGRDGKVTIEELVLVVRIQKNMTPLGACVAADADHSGSVSSDDVVAAIENALAN